MNLQFQRQRTGSPLGMLRPCRVVGRFATVVGVSLFWVLCAREVCAQAAQANKSTNEVKPLRSQGGRAHSSFLFTTQLNCRLSSYSADGNFHSSHYVSSEGMTPTYELVIPVDTDLKLWVESVGIPGFRSKRQSCGPCQGRGHPGRQGKSGVQLDLPAVAAK